MNGKAYKSGLCAEMALALHEATGLPLGLISGAYTVTQEMVDRKGSMYFDEDVGQTHYENCHAVVIVSQKAKAWLDVDGEHKGLADADCLFQTDSQRGAPIEEVVLRRVSREEVEDAFSMGGVEESAVEEAKEFLLSQPWFQQSKWGSKNVKAKVAKALLAVADKLEAASASAKRSKTPGALYKAWCKREGLSPSEVNNGNCDEAAHDVAEKIPGATPVYTEDVIDNDDWPGHCWVKWNGKHYDAECPDGVESWQSLPLFQKFLQREASTEQEDKNALLAVAAELEAASSPMAPVLYHGTTTEALPSILSGGLKVVPGWGGAGTEGVYLSNSKTGALMWAMSSLLSKTGEGGDPSRFFRKHSLDELALVEVRIPESELENLKADMEQAEDYQYDGEEDDWQASLDQIGDVRFDGPVPASWITALSPQEVEAAAAKLGIKKAPWER
jgi:hypothetical protein